MAMRVSSEIAQTQPDKSDRHVRAGKANMLKNGLAVCPTCGFKQMGTDHFEKIGQKGGRASVEAGVTGGKMSMRERRRQPGAGRRKSKNIDVILRMEKEGDSKKTT